MTCGVFGVSVFVLLTPEDVYIPNIFLVSNGGHSINGQTEPSSGQAWPVDVGERI